MEGTRAINRDPMTQGPRPKVRDPRPIGPVVLQQNPRPDDRDRLHGPRIAASDPRGVYRGRSIGISGRRLAAYLTAINGRHKKARSMAGW